MGKFCVDLRPLDPYWTNFFNELTKVEIWYTPRGKCIVAINGIEINKTPHHKTDNKQQKPTE